MPRLLAGLVFVALVPGLWTASADDPPGKLNPEERKQLEARLGQLNGVATKAQQAGNYPEAQKAYESALGEVRRLYPKDEFPDGHTDLGGGLNNLGFILLLQGKFADAERYLLDALDMRKRLFKGDHPDLAVSTNVLGGCFREQGKLADAERLFRGALEMNKRLFKGDHSELAGNMNNLALVLQARGKPLDAEPLFRDALGMYKRVYTGDHPTVAISLTNLGGVFRDQGKLAETEALYREALEMRRRLFTRDHPDLAKGLNNLAVLLRQQGKYEAAEPLFRDALAMHKRLFKGDHPNVAISLYNLAAAHWARAKLDDAERGFRDALNMSDRLFKGDHPVRARSLNSLAWVLRDQGKYADAQPFARGALEMWTRLAKGDHAEVAVSLSNVAGVLHAQGRPAEATPLFRDALAMSRRLIATVAAQRGEGDALTMTASLPLYRDALLSNERARTAAPAEVYPEVWADKGSVTRVYEQRQEQARAAAADPRAATMLAELAEVRRRRAELILAPEVRDPATRAKREEEIKNFDKKIAQLGESIRPLLPTIERAERLARAIPADLQRVLPADAAVVDFLRYVYLECDQDKPGKKGERLTESYLAFVVTKDGITWVELGPAGPIEAAIHAWREGITSGKEIPAAVAARVRELVWAKVRKELVAGIKTVYIAPDMALCQVPWAALPGDKPGTVLLEDFAVATIPHGTFLLDQLWPQDARKNPPAGLLVVGGVDYQAEAATGRQANRDLPVKPGAKGWPALPGAASEATGVAGAATTRKLAVTPLKAEKATAPAVLAELPRARYAHFATHGFFADASFRSVFQLDSKQFEMRGRGERVGAGALSPLVMTGLVLAGANDPKTPGRGIVTGESLIDLDLSGLEIAVLSACETGLGDVAGGEGTFGLQRAFHMAGVRNVVASLWKVPDRPTAALMALFYRNLWEKNLTPIEALRQAQLEIYRNPDKIGALAEGFRSKFDEVPGLADAEIKAGADGRAHPRLWAAFTLSGPGR